MVASKYTRASSASGLLAGERPSGMPRAGLGSVALLLDRAEELRLRAPELTLVLAERAAALAEAAGLEGPWIRAESLVVSAKVRLGDRPAAVGRAVAVLRAAEDAGHNAVAARLRIDLAICARSVGAPLTGLAALRPVLADRELPGAHRAEALCHLVGCLAQFGRKTELDRVLVEADKICSAGERMDADALSLRALLRVGISAHRRRHGDLMAAADAARTGLGFLDRLDKPEADGGFVRVRLILQLACTLLDRGNPEMALEISQPALAAPIRAGSAGPAGWLRFAIATRVQLPAGAGEAATMMLREAVHSTDRHGLFALTAKLWLELAQLEERLGRPSEAIECLYWARAAEHVHMRARRQAYGLLAGEFGTGEGQAPVDLAEVIGAENPEATFDAPVPSRSPEVSVALEPRVVRAGADELPSPVSRDHQSTARVNGLAAPPSGLPELPAAPTRHDCEHGLEAARSVLDRLGVPPGGGGGRRRMHDGSPALTRPGSSMAVSSPARAGEDTAAVAALAQPARDETFEREGLPARTGGPSNDVSRERTDSWLPRLRMPPPLEPLDGQDFGWPVSETYDSPSEDSPSDDSASGGSDAADFRGLVADSYARAVAEDEPSSDAGIAELLVRALAEHQAGTASAAALVKQLGSKREDVGVRRAVNGHSRAEESSDSGR